MPYNISARGDRGWQLRKLNVTEGLSHLPLSLNYSFDPSFILVASVRQCRIPRFDPWLGKIPPEEEMSTHSSILAWRYILSES